MKKNNQSLSDNVEAVISRMHKIRLAYSSYEHLLNDLHSILTSDSPYIKTHVQHFLDALSDENWQETDVTAVVRLLKDVASGKLSASDAAKEIESLSQHAASTTSGLFNAIGFMQDFLNSEVVQNDI